MNTMASTVEKGIIQRYCQRQYVNSPATKRKKEYHRRVSPIVRKGGRSRVVHNMAMNPAIAIMASDIKATAQMLRSFLSTAIVDPVAASNTTPAAQIGNMFQPILVTMND